MEHLKFGFKAIINTAMTINKALEDKRISALEWAQIAIKSIGFWRVIKNIEPIRQEFQSLTPEDKAELAQWATQNFDLRNDQLEEIIKKAMTIAVQLSNSFFKK
ncbi:MAG: hypothetical protein PF694_07015 [Bacteroidetes bacterium]|jgi:hypothetical protein|nr:hypothetical protein [Bacteroidota bacterium]